MLATIAIIISLANTIFCDCSNNDSISHYCETPECIHTASNILKSMDETIPPCENFYKFACGGFNREHIITDDATKIDHFSLLSDKVEKELKTLISEEHSESDAKYLSFPNALYKACMNISLRNEFDAQPMKEISNDLGGWPVVEGESWNSDGSWSWQKLVKQFRKLGFHTNYILSFYVMYDFKNTSKYFLTIDEPLIGLYREYLVEGFNGTMVKAYYNFMVDLAVKFGADKQTAERELHDSLQFEMDLANISVPSEERRNYTALYNILTVDEIQQKYPYIDWLNYFNTLLLENQTLTKDEPIKVISPSYFDELESVLRRTPNRTIANYMMWRIHKYAATFLSDRFQESYFEFFKVVFGIQEKQPLWKRCIAKTVENLPMSVGLLYIQKHFNSTSKRVVKEMSEHIRNAFFENLKQIPWMDNVTAKAAQEKLNTMKYMIGYPDELTDEKKMEEHHHGLNINSDEYLESILKINIFRKDSEFSKVRLPVNELIWTEFPAVTTVNAFYDFFHNIFGILAGILQGQFFNVNRLNYMNYGSMGSILGHEIVHGFDDQGKQFDLNGNLLNWWQANTEEAYLSKVDCIVQQYENYTDNITGLKLNGIATQDENIADNGGFKIAYIAYKNWVKENGPEPTLPGLKYTPEQLYWISAAQSWCTNYKKEYLENLLKTNVHSPAEFRILGSMRNNKDFSEDFGCPLGSSMNPIEKCEIW